MMQGVVSRKLLKVLHRFDFQQYRTIIRFSARVV